MQLTQLIERLGLAPPSIPAPKLSKPNSRVWPGSRYPTPHGDLIVFKVRPVGRGYQVRALERFSDLALGEFWRVQAQEDFLREVAP